MNDRVLALLVHDQSYPADALNQALRDLSIDTYSVRTCREAQKLIAESRPHLIFTDICLADGSWSDVVALAGDAQVPTNVIVMAANPDVGQYLEVMERGAFDFIAPPFEREMLWFVVRAAQLDTSARRPIEFCAAMA